MGRYDEVFRASVTDPEGFWLGAAGAIDWQVKPVRALDSSNPPFYRWFPDGELNVSYNAVDRHVEAGRGEQAAVIYDSPVTGTRRTLSYRKLRDQVALFAGVLAGLGVGKGDRVLIYLPMIPQAVIAMLGCARLGAVHSVVVRLVRAQGTRVADRRRDTDGDRVGVLRRRGQEGRRVPAEVEQGDRDGGAPTCHAGDRAAPGRGRAGTGRRQLDEGDGLGDAGGPGDGQGHRSAVHAAHVRDDRETEGRRPGQRRVRGGVGLVDANVYDIGPGDIMFTAADVGWVVGHSYTVYGPLLAGATTVLYEGDPVGTPDAGQFWRVASE